MKLIDWFMQRNSTDFFDYSSIILRIEVLERELGIACLHKQFNEVPALVDELIEEAILLKKWAKQQK